MDYTENTSGILSKRKYLGLVGNKILERFDVIIDYINSYLYVKPNKKFNKPFKASKKGFYCKNRSETLKGFIVSGFYKNSNAEKSGLKIDDKIIKVNGQKVSTTNYKKIKEIIKKADSLELGIIRQDSIHLNFKFKNDIPVKL